MNLPELQAEYFAGGRSLTVPVRVRIRQDRLLISGDGVERDLPLSELTWPRRTARGPRVASMRDGGAIYCSDAARWDQWADACGHRAPPASFLRSSWPWLAGLASVLLLLVALGAGSYLWGIPWVAKAVVAVVPLSADTALGEASLASAEAELLAPSTLPETRQAALRDAFARAVAGADGTAAPTWRLLFRSARDPAFGPNAFALPGGVIVLTDELVRLLEGQDDTLVGVLAHELGHVRHRHGMRLLAQNAALGIVASLVLGDLGSVMAAGPLLLGQAAYSRDAEREADAESVRVMKAAGISPLAMVRFFDLLATLPARTPAGDGPPRWVGIAVASHPDDVERIRFFREAAATTIIR